MEKFVRQTLLFDFYGELLTEHQKRIYEDVVCNDMSCSEVAAEQGVSRQVEEYEEKLHLVQKFLDIQNKVRLIREEALRASDEKRMPDVQGILRISDEILEEL